MHTKGGNGCDEDLMTREKINPNLYWKEDLIHQTLKEITLVEANFTGLANL